MPALTRFSHQTPLLHSLQTQAPAPESSYLLFIFNYQNLPHAFFHYYPLLPFYVLRRLSHRIQGLVNTFLPKSGRKPIPVAQKQPYYDQGKVIQNPQISRTTSTVTGTVIILVPSFLTSKLFLLPRPITRLHQPTNRLANSAKKYSHPA